MAAPTNAHQRTDISQEAEDVRDVIYDVSPEECPFISNAPVASADNTTHQWHTDALRTAVATNAHIDGDVFAGDAISSPTRLDNECQIFREDIIVTRRARKLAKYGPTDELARQVTRSGRALKRDMEMSMLYNNAKVVDNGSSAPELAGLPTWIIGTSDGRASRGATAGADPASLGAVKTDGDPRALDESAILGVVTAIYKKSSVKPNVLLLDPDSKVNFSNYMFTSSARIATQYQDQGPSNRGGLTVVGAVDVWVTDFAVLEVVPDNFLPENVSAGEYDAFIYNTGECDVAYFDTMQTNAMAKTADTDDRMILADCTLVVRNPDSLGTFADINNGTAMVA